MDSCNLCCLVEPLFFIPPLVLVLPQIGFSKDTRMPFQFTAPQNTGLSLLLLLFKLSKHKSVHLLLAIHLETLPVCIRMRKLILAKNLTLAYCFQDFTLKIISLL